MAAGRPLVEYIKSKCYSGLFKVAEKMWKTRGNLCRYIQKRFGKEGLVDATVQRVYVADLPGMMVKFDIGLEFELEVEE